MHLFYVDDSGNVNDNRQRYFILAGFSVFEAQTYFLSRQIDEVMKECGISQDLELHGNPMLKGSNVWRGYPKQSRIDCIHKCLRTMTDPRFRVFATVVDKEKHYTENPVILAFEQISSRFDQYLMRLYRNDS